MDGASSALLLLGIGGVIAFLIMSRIASNKDAAVNEDMSKQVVDLLKRQRAKKKKRAKDAVESFAEAKADYESKFGSISGTDDDDGPSAS